MTEPQERTSPEGLWQGCDNMEAAAFATLSRALAPFDGPVRHCYEAGVQAPTLAGTRQLDRDMILAAPFLKRSLNDLRAVWLLTHLGYTSQAASVAAAIFEHSLAVNALAGSPQNAQQLENDRSGDLPWSPIQLSRIHADQQRQEAQRSGKPFSDQDYERMWREAYLAYQYLCKIKHPTLRSTLHDAPSASITEGEYVVMAAPDLRTSDLPVKATVLTISMSRVYQAIRRFTLSLDCDTTSESYVDFLARMAKVCPAVAEAFAYFVKRPLPFDVADTRVMQEYHALRSDST